MFSLLLSLLTRFSFAQVVTAVAVTTAATVAVAGSAEVVATFDRAASAAGSVDAGASATAGMNPALAVLASPVQIDPEYVLKSVTYRVAEEPTSIGAIVLRLEQPSVLPASITVQAASPSGAHYRCNYERVRGELLVTCDTRSPSLPVAQVNRLFVEIQS